MCECVWKRESDWETKEEGRRSPPLLPLLLIDTSGASCWQWHHRGVQMCNIRPSGCTCFLQPQNLNFIDTHTYAVRIHTHTLLQHVEIQRDAHINREHALRRGMVSTVICKRVCVLECIYVLSAFNHSRSIRFFKNIFERNLLWSTSLHLIDKNTVKTVILWNITTI